MFVQKRISFFLFFIFFVLCPLFFCPFISRGEQIYPDRDSQNRFLQSGFQEDSTTQPSSNIPPLPSSLELLYPLSRSEANQKIVLVLDPGHGGTDFGVNGTHGLLEKNLTLDIVYLIQEVLFQKNPKIQIVLTRLEDRTMSLTERAQKIVQSKAFCFVSVHVDASFDSSLQGPAFYISDCYQKTLQLEPEAKKSLEQHSRRFAQSLKKSFFNQIPSWPTRDVHAAPIALLEMTPVFGVECELGNLNNPSDFENLSSVLFKRKIAEAIAEGILQFLSERF